MTKVITALDEALEVAGERAGIARDVEDPPGLKRDNPLKNRTLKALAWRVDYDEIGLHLI